jgi:hypothetical protein
MDGERVSLHGITRHRCGGRNRRKAESRARAQLAKADAASRKLREKEAQEAPVEAMLAEVDEQNQWLADIYEDIDTLLEATLSRDDYVDLNTLRVVVAHPPFDRTELEIPTARPAPIPDPFEPILSLPEPPRGLGEPFREEETPRSRLSKMPNEPQNRQDTEKTHVGVRLSKSNWPRCIFRGRCTNSCFRTF